MPQVKVALTIEGMSCVSCTQVIEKSIRLIPGVTEINVHFATGKAHIQYNPEKASEEMLLEAVSKAGYHAEIHHEGAPRKAKEVKEQADFREFAIAAFLTLPLLLQMIGMFLGFRGSIPDWIQFLLATSVQFWSGRRFYKSSVQALSVRSANMDVLIAMGTSAAWGFSFFVLLFGLNQPLYFESSAMIITLILLGRWLESRSKGKASAAIEKLIQIQPRMATVERDGEMVDIPIEEVHINNILFVRPGDTLPVDGVVVEGQSAVDESMLTGESLSIMKLTGHQVFAGTLNKNGSLKVRATQVGTDTALSAMVRLVEQAQNSKAPIQRLADQISEIFVPTVLVISALTLISWLIAGSVFSAALISAVSVLIIACPCALGLATPTVIMVSSGRAAEMGILFKEAQAIERTEKINTLIFDKTGTLTEGKPSVQEIVPTKEHTIEEVLMVAASIEHHSKHPLAEAIVAKAEESHIPLEPSFHFESLNGKGVKATKRNVRYALGSTRFANEEKKFFEQSIVDKWQQEGKTVILLWNEEEVLGYITVSDPLKEHTKKTIDALHEENYYTLMLTGDGKRTAAAIAHQVGIDEFYAEVLPENKAEMVQHLRGTGKYVGMVGDGINDAPALAAADVGFATDTGSDIAIEASDVTLLGGDLLGVVRALELAKITFKKIRQNLFFAFFYNSLGIPLAALGYLNPVIAAAAMAASSLCVVTNAILLKDWKPTA